MAKIVVAFPDKAQNRQLATLLSGAGLDVFRTCMTGNEVMRAFNQCQDGILVCGARFSDRLAADLIDDLGERVLALLVGKPEQLALCEHPRAFKLTLPASRGELTASVDMLVQLHYKRLPHRSRAENDAVAEAKVKLMTARGIGEEQAHRLLQQTSMRLGAKLTDVAQRILDGSLSLD